MTNWKKLTESSDSTVKRGTLLRFPAGEAFEDRVVMMVCEAPNQMGRLGLMAISGYKAGINCYVVFPEHSGSDCISIQWLIENWQMWVWPEGDVNEVEVREPLNALEIS
ncbi:Imm45 family immunity protein [Burkholderia multivorans]|nr:immunity 45 family protein [Burkholderia multivorans]MDN7882268.1 Imm45 family immunity protein [Burkholderia multivorans]MDN7976899.1 Imm45 family immunity protein [Burkholderia multivorans]MDN7978124.1 Imm45 family immunity protein [Burkholderia multivorans]MDN7983671.1 Imm45 family immunity protein [Burkholderia multivorans]